jgi:hypothetical protein
MAQTAEGLAFLQNSMFYKEMSRITAEEFFRLYEQANSDFDVQLISKLYADIFMFANPQGVQTVKKEDFVKVLPRRKEFMRAAGLLSSRVDSVSVTKLDSKYILVKTVWKMRVRAHNGAEVASNTSATYILSVVGDSLEIVFQVDHENLAKTVQHLRANSDHS